MALPDLARASDLWEYWGFAPWSADGMAGVYRRVTFVKNALLGEVCRYYADDYILWRHNGESDKERVLRNARPQPDLMTQRYLFVEERSSNRQRRGRSFLFGFRGYAEVFSFTPGVGCDGRIKDLGPLVERAIALILSGKMGGGGGAGET